MQSFDKDDILQTINHVFSSVLPSRLQPVITSLASELLYIIPQPYRDEIVGISKALDIKLGDAVLMNIVYDLTAYKGLGFKYISRQPRMLVMLESLLVTVQICSQSLVMKGMRDPLSPTYCPS